jgi:hypothetical protein
MVAVAILFPAFTLPHDREAATTQIAPTIPKKLLTPVAARFFQ